MLPVALTDEPYFPRFLSGGSMKISTRDSALAALSITIPSKLYVQNSRVACWHKLWPTSWDQVELVWCFGVSSFDSILSLSWHREASGVRRMYVGSATSPMGQCIMCGPYATDPHRSLLVSSVDVAFMRACLPLAQRLAETSRQYPLFPAASLHLKEYFGCGATLNFLWTLESSNVSRRVGWVNRSRLSGNCSCHRTKSGHHNDSTK